MKMKVLIDLEFFFVNFRLRVFRKGLNFFINSLEEKLNENYVLFTNICAKA